MGPAQQEFAQRNLHGGLMPANGTATIQGLAPTGWGQFPARSLGAAAAQGENVIKEALQYLVGLSEPMFREEGDGRVYSSRSMAEMQPPMPVPYEVHTLAGFCALYKLRDDSEKLFVNIPDHLSVLLVEKELDPWRRRAVVALARVPQDAPRFRFGQWLEPEEFIIGMQTMFEDGDYDFADHRKIVKLVSNLAAEMVTISSDDGYSQSVATKQGIVTKAEEKVHPRVRLSPWRTFREVGQPSSEFILRLRGRQGQQPSCALWEADGGSWRNDAIKNIKEFLAKELPDADIVA